MATLSQVLEEQGFEANIDTGEWEYGFTGSVTERIRVRDGVEDWLFVDNLTGDMIEGAGAKNLETLLIKRGL